MLKKTLPGWLFLLLLVPLQAQYLDLTELIKTGEYHLEWNPLTETAVLSRNDTLLVLKPGVPYVIVNYTTKEAITPLIKHKQRLLLPADSLETIQQIFAREEQEQLSRKVAVIILDPGHGGKDPGTMATYHTAAGQVTVYEKDIVLKIALKLEAYLKTNYPGIRIVLTRSDDTFVELEDRSQIANRISTSEQDAILFISLHANSGFNKKATGFEVWHLPGNYRRTLLDEKNTSPDEEEIVDILNSMLEEEFLIESIKLADSILQQLDNQVGELTENRGLREEAWYVVRKTNMPSILVEVGFVSNQEEALRMTQESYLNKLALGIYNGISEFITHFESTEGFTR